MNRRDGTPQRQKGGRTPFQPTHDQRVEVRALAATGTPQEIIAKYLSVTVDCLQTHFRKELDEALLRMLQGVARNLVSIATHGKGSAAVRAAQTILGRRAAWWAPQPMNVNLGITDGTTTAEDQRSVRERILSRIDAINTAGEPRSIN